MDNILGTTEAYYGMAEIRDVFVGQELDEGGDERESDVEWHRRAAQQSESERVRSSPPGSLLFIAMPDGERVPYRVTEVGEGLFWLRCLYGDMEDRSYSVSLPLRTCTCGSYDYECSYGPTPRSCKHIKALTEHRRKKNGKQRQG